MKTVVAKYSCNACGDHDIKVTVRERFKNEDIKNYVEATAQALGDVHGVRNPFCPCRKLDVSMPVGVDKDGEVRIGFSDVRELTKEERDELNKQLKRSDAHESN